MIIKDIDLDKTFNSGQCFRWNKVGKVWVGVVGGKIYGCYVNNLGEITCSDSEINKYLGLAESYVFDDNNLDKFALESIEYSRGIKILHQDPWEMIVSYIISQRNNIPKIKTTIEKICEAAGEPISNEIFNREFTGYKFPDASRIVELGQNGLERCGLGYRAEYVYNVAKRVLDGKLDISKLYTYGNQELVIELQKEKGIGPKVANCIALYGFGRLGLFPIDIWMQRIIDKYYDGRLDSRRYGEYAGVMQQYMFYNIRR